MDASEAPAEGSPASAVGSPAPAVGSPAEQPLRDEGSYQLGVNLYVFCVTNSLDGLIFVKRRASQEALEVLFVSHWLSER